MIPYFLNNASVFSYIFNMKEKFIKSTLILLIGGGITKVLGLVIKMVMGRLIGSEGLGLYMMILPTFSLFIGISQFGLPIALSKLVAEDTKNNRRLFASVIPISMVINVFLILFIWLMASTLANDLLKNSDTYYGILAISVVIPFISLSSICRSYFFGKERMVPHVISNVVEDVVRLIIMIVGIPFFLKKGINYAVCFLILSNIISESASIIVLLLFLPKKFSIKARDLRPSKSYMRESLSIGIPNTCGRLVGSVGYFLEPILLTAVLHHVGYSSSFITNQYGILSGYVMPILLLPSFFTGAISNALLPIISKEYSLKRYAQVKKKLKLGIAISLAIGIFLMSFFVLIPEVFLSLIYHTEQGSSYMRFLAPICLLQYIQAPLSSSLEAMGKSKTVLTSSLLGVATRCILLVVLSLLKIGLWGLILSISLNVIVVTIYELIMIRKFLK